MPLFCILLLLNDFYYICIVKRVFVISVILFSVLLLACGKQQKPVAEQPLPFTFDDNLLQIDSLMQTDADSALMSLTSFRPTEGSGEISSTFNTNYQSLLISEALYKTYNPQLNRYRNETFQETSLHEAVQYFDSLYICYPKNDDLALLLARSHYMNGVGYYENDSVVDACKEYLKTLEIMENHFDDSELIGYKAKFMALTYGRLEELFSDRFMIEPTIYCGKRSLFYCNIEPTSKYGISKSLSTIGQQYHEMDNYDSALYYYQLALYHLPDYNNGQYRDIISLLKLLDYQMGENPQIALDSLRKMVARANNYDEKLTRFLTMGYIFYKETQYDSAIVYLETIYYNQEDVLSKMQAAEYLRNIYKTYNDTEKSDVFSKILADNTMTAYYTKTITTDLNDLYQQYVKHKANKRFLQEKDIARKRTALTTIPIVVLLVVIVFLVMRKWNKKHIARHKAELSKIENSLHEIRMRLDVKQFTGEPICKDILDTVKKQQFKSKIHYINYKDFALGREQIVELRAAINLHYDNFTIKLKDRFPGLTDDDINYCCLYMLGLNDSDVSALMQKDYSTIRYRRNKIKSTLKTGKSISEALYNLSSLK